MCAQCHYFCRARNAHVNAKIIGLIVIVTILLLIITTTMITVFSNYEENEQASL